MIQTKTPPWNSTKPYDEYTDIESVFLWAYDEAFSERVAVVERAWSELCALQAVAEAVQEYVVVTNSIATLSRVTEVWDRVKSALAALEAICPK